MIIKMESQKNNLQANFLSILNFSLQTASFLMLERVQVGSQRDCSLQRASWKSPLQIPRWLLVLPADTIHLLVRINITVGVGNTVSPERIQEKFRMPRKEWSEQIKVGNKRDNLTSLPLIKPHCYLLFITSAVLSKIASSRDITQVISFPCAPGVLNIQSVQNNYILNCLLIVVCTVSLISSVRS